uniref:Uncharacterized protein n=1 Tax=Arundo donax TaxID=35708 RepID=A0A0A9FRY4_ARUDO
MQLIRLTSMGIEKN